MKATSPCGAGSCGQNTLAQNAEAYGQYVDQAASQGVNIIVSVLYGLVVAISLTDASTGLP
jgi:hypothetical protein